MLRLVLLVIYLAAMYTAGQPSTTDVRAGLDPNGVAAETQPPTADVKAGLDPDGLIQTPSTTDVKAGLDPNG